MTWRSVLATALLAASGAGPGAALADMIDTSGLEPWESCALCHGLDGISRMPKFPRLAGQPVPYLVKQLEDFRAGRRQNDGGVMADNAGLLPPGDIPIIARYFSEQAEPSPVPAGEDADLEHGARLFLDGRAADGLPACAGCHVEQAGSGIFPRITAQHPAYIARQLRAFRSADRTNDPRQVMRNVAALLSDTDIDAVAAYATARPRREHNRP